MNPTRLESVRSTLRQNRVIIAASGNEVVHHPFDATRNRHADAAQAVAAIVVAIRVTQIHGIQNDRENIQDENVHRPMIAQANRAKVAVTDMTSTQEKKATQEVIATKEVDTELHTLLLLSKKNKQYKIS